MTNKKQHSINVLENYLDSLREKGIKVKEPKDYKELGRLAIIFLSAEFEIDNPNLSSHQRNSFENIPEDDKRYQAATYLVKLETKNFDKYDEDVKYLAYNNNGDFIAAFKGMRSLAKYLRKYFKGMYRISYYRLQKGLSNNNLTFDWGYLEVHRKEGEI